ncbi:MAG: ATP-binding cassette domain-containing protein [Planctomycetota bacterium]|jgi:ABC-2 type transport system ATP-binding protein|nr:ATP-binding cassette domain-containing protein [Planctomycetota bacterium]
MASTPAILLDDVVLARTACNSRPLNLRLAASEKLLLLGSNGCGKTTLAESICRHLLVADGQIQVADEVGYCPQRLMLPGQLKVSAFLQQLQTLCPHTLRFDTEACIKLFGLDEYANSKISSLSRGWQQRVNLAQAWLGSPDLIILDEPQTALDPDGLDLLRDAIDNSNCAVLVVAPPNIGCEALLNNHVNFDELC